MEIFFAWIGFAVLTGWIASGKGRSGFGWFLFGLCLPLIALIAAIVIESPARKEERAAVLALARSATMTRSAPLAPAAPAPEPERQGTSDRPRKDYSSYIAGLAYPEPGEVQTRGEWLKRKGLSMGSRLDLRREPDNPHDPGAVSVLWQGQRCGYIPDEHDWIGEAMDRGDDIDAFVDTIEKADDPLARIHVQLRISAPQRPPRVWPTKDKARVLEARQIEGLTCIDQPDGSIQVIIGDKAHVFADEDQLKAVIAGIRAKAG